MRLNPFSAITSKLFAGLSVVLLLAVAVQTIRANHYHAKYTACATARIAEHESWRRASDAALAAAQAQKAAVEARYAAQAKEADHEYATDLADARAATDRYIASHRVPGKTVADHRSSASAAAQGSGAGVPADVPDNSIVVVSDADVRACTNATTYAVKAHDWAAGL